MLSVEKLDGKMEGAKVSFDDVLLTDDGSTTKTGATLKGAKVGAEVVEAGRAKKVTIIRYKAKSRYFKKRGHRQPFTKVKITSIA